MSEFIPKYTNSSFRDKVVVLTGGATGIGAAFLRLLTGNGAYVVIGDVNEPAATEIVKECCASFPSKQESKPRALFHKTDVTSYEANLGLFDTALKTYGHIDHAVAAAGIVEIGNWFDPSLTLEAVREKPTTKVLDINLLGPLYFSRIATVYLQQNRPQNADRSITLVSSVAGFKETPGMFLYSATKHGVLGLMRALRPYLPESHKTRVNAVLPWMTDTAITKGIKKQWEAAGCPINTPKQVAEIMMGMLAEERMNGKATFVGSGRAFEIEENLDRLEPQWLGEEPSTWLTKGQATLGNGLNWAQ